jgi:fructose-1,6-bisphosphatase-3
MFSHGALYKTMNGNLFYHGCMIFNERGNFKTVEIDGKKYKGAAYLSKLDRMIRAARKRPVGKAQADAAAIMWYLWLSEDSPLFGKDKMTTFERYFIEDKATHKEHTVPYYKLIEKEETANKILREFGLNPETGRILNGHVPVKAKKGESPIKGGGKLIVIDGGFSKAYQPTSGIAGYTLIFSSRHFRIVSHQPFSGKYDAIHKNDDIANDSLIFEKMATRMKVSETDEGYQLQAQVDDLLDLLDAFRSGAVTEDHKE